MSEMELENKPLIECLVSLGRGQSPTYIEEESGTFAINQKCVRNGAVDAFHSRPHDQKIRVKDSALLQDGDVCINSTGTGTIGRVGLWSSKGLHNGTRYFADSHVTIARPNKEVVNPKYLATLLESASVQTTMETYCFSGSTNQVELNRTALETLKISILGREAQNKVASILSTLDRAIEQTEAIIAKQQRIKAGLMQDLLTKGIDEHGSIRSEDTHEFKDSPLGRIPVEWEVTQLSELAEAIDPQPDHRTPPQVDDGIPYIGISDFNKDGSIDFARARKISPTAYRKQVKSFEIGNGDFVFGKIGTIGLPKLLTSTVNYALSANVILLKPKEESTFVYWWMVSPIVENLVALEIHSTSQPAFGIQKMRTLAIPKISIDESHQIGTAFDGLARSMKSAEDQLSKLNKLKAGLMHDLLTGTVRLANP